MAKSSATTGAQFIGVLIIGGLIGYWSARPSGNANQAATDASSSAATSAARGAQLVTLGGCDDCHTPKHPDGSPDMSRRFAGYDNTAGVPEARPGTISANMQLTAWHGPWGLSFSRNITPDKETGIGNWTFEQFKQTLVKGQDPSGHALMPPMPSQAMSQMPEADLRAIFNFLQTVPPIQNKVTGP